MRSPCEFMNWPDFAFVRPAWCVVQCTAHHFYFLPQHNTITNTHKHSVTHIQIYISHLGAVLSVCVRAALSRQKASYFVIFIVAAAAATVVVDFFFCCWDRHSVYRFVWKLTADPFLWCALPFKPDHQRSQLSDTFLLCQRAIVRSLARCWLRLWQRFHSANTNPNNKLYP